MAAELPTPDRDPGAVRDAVREVLSRPDFRTEQPSFLQRAVEWLLERIARVFAQIGAGGRGGVIGLILFLLVVAGVLFLVLRFARGLTADPGYAAGAALPRRSGTDWRAEAERNEQAGDWRGGLRCRYRALIADLAARGLVDEVPGTTAGEYRGQVRRNAPGQAADFAGATELFELAWYGNRPTGPDESGRFRGLADKVLSS